MRYFTSKMSLIYIVYLRWCMMSRKERLSNNCLYSSGTHVQYIFFMYDYCYIVYCYIVYCLIMRMTQTILCCRCHWIHLQLHASQIRQKAQHPPHKLTIHPHTPRLIKQTTFNNINYTTNIDTVTQQQISANSTQIHTGIVQTHLMQRNHNKLIHQHAPKISPSELSLPRETRRTLAQLRTNKSPILISYLHKVDETHHPSPLCPLCNTHSHTTFSTAHTYIPQAIYWTSGCLPREWRPLLIRWKRRLAGLL